MERHRSHPADGRADHTATLINDGRVLVTGGRGKTATAEVYDPDAGSWTSAGTLSVWRAQHTASLLSDGRVLVAGGPGEQGNTTDIFDPGTGTWSSGKEMQLSRYVHTATVLSDGRVLIVGGQSTDDGGDRILTNTAEIYEP